jgi:prepilin-type N-terminal cleavage/methylation domain-containing protein
MSLPYLKTRLQQGFSLVEMMVAVAVLAILAAIAAPDMRDLIIGNRLTAATNDRLGLLQFARAEAVRRGRVINLILNADGTWRVEDPLEPEDKRILRTVSAATGVTIESEDGTIAFSSNGTTANTGSISLKSETSKGEEIDRTITVLGSGKAFLN